MLQTYLISKLLVALLVCAALGGIGVWRAVAAKLFD